MIIECPACATRYNIAVPEGGRSVRCKKCATIWRAMPETVVASETTDNERANTEPQLSYAPAASSGPAGNASELFGTAEASSAYEVRQQSPESEARAHESHQDADQGLNAPARSSLNGHDQGESADKTQEEPTPSIGEGRQPSSTDTDTSESGSEKVRWFGNFRKRAEARSSQVEVAPQVGLSPSGLSTAETIPFPSRQIMPKQKPEPEGVEGDGAEIRTLEEAREAVREVFSSLSDTRTVVPEQSYARPVLDPHLSLYDHDDRSDQSGHTNSGNVLEYETRQSERYGHDRADTDEYEQETATGVGNLYEQKLASVRDTTSEADSTENADADGDTGAPTARRADDGASDTDFQDTADDPDAHLRAAFTSRPQNREFVADLTRQESERGLDDERLARELETQLRPSQREHNQDWDDKSAPAFFSRPTLPLDSLAHRDARDATDQDVADDGGYDPRLYRELEETREHPERSRPRGGLALAAAWGLFLCAASGIIVGFFSFRENAAEQLPGLAPVYRALRMPVTIQPLLFENIQYRWDETSAKPTLIVTGAIYNRAKRNVRIPAFHVAIKHRNTELDRDYPVTLKTANRKIRAGQREEFEIELVSPDPSIRSVELELRQVQ